MENYIIIPPLIPSKNLPHPSYDVTNSVSDLDSAGELTQRDLTQSSHIQNPKIILEKLKIKNQIFNYVNSSTSTHKSSIKAAQYLPEIGHNKYFQCNNLNATYSTRFNDIQNEISNRISATTHNTIFQSHPSTPVNRNHYSHTTIYHTEVKPINKDTGEWQFKCKCPKGVNAICCRKAMKWFEQSKKFKNSVNFNYSDMRRKYLVHILNRI